MASCESFHQIFPYVVCIERQLYGSHDYRFHPPALSPAERVYRYGLEPHQNKTLPNKNLTIPAQKHQQHPAKVAPPSKPAGQPVIAAAPQLSKIVAPATVKPDAECLYHIRCNLDEFPALSTPRQIVRIPIQDARLADGECPIPFFCNLKKLFNFIPSPPKPPPPEPAPIPIVVGTVSTAKPQMPSWTHEPPPTTPDFHMLGLGILAFAILCTAIIAHRTNLIRVTLQTLYKVYVIFGAVLSFHKGIALIAVGAYIFLWGWKLAHFNPPSLDLYNVTAAFIFMLALCFLSSGASSFFKSLPTFTPAPAVNVPSGAGTSRFASRTDITKGGIT